MRLKVRKVRPIFQIVFLFLFFCLFISTEPRGEDEIRYPVKIFLEFDPFIALNVIFANRSFSGISYFFVFTLFVTVFLGRVFCGWVCPLGFINDLVAKVKSRGNNRERGWFRIKYFVLTSIFAASIFSLQMSGYFDPLSLLVRSLTISIYPSLVLVLDRFVDLFYSSQFLKPFADYLYTFLKLTLLPFRTPKFSQSFFVGSLFLLILFLNMVEKRFWCKYICPLGALLGIFSFFPLIRRSISEDCVSCGKCELNCAGGLMVKRGKWYVSECIECFECEDACQFNAIRNGVSGKKEGVDLKKRHLLLSFFFGGLSVPLIRINPLYGERYFHPRLIRPPGSVEEWEFLRRCVRCGECMKVCPTGGLQPALLEAGLEGMWTPILVPRIGYCEFKCTMCGQVCPSSAIRKLSSKEKEGTKIGLAIIDKSRCIPYAFGRPCIVCEEVCPTPKKAIWFEEREVIDREGKVLKVKQPRVDPDLCVGCGICEAKCPMLGAPAIFVINVQESRSDKKRIFF